MANSKTVRYTGSKQDLDRAVQNARDDLRAYLDHLEFQLLPTSKEDTIPLRGDDDFVLTPLPDEESFIESFPVSYLLTDLRGVTTRMDKISRDEEGWYAFKVTYQGEVAGHLFSKVFYEDSELFLRNIYRNCGLQSYLKDQTSWQMKKMSKKLENLKALRD